MEWWQAVVLGVVQGLTEFLPISSSAHVRVVGELIADGQDPGAAFSAIVQIGTEVAVLLYFRRDLLRIVTAWWHALRGAHGPGWRERLGGPDPDARIGWWIILGSVPIVVLGLAFQDAIESTVRNLYLIAGSLVVFALVLGWADRVGARRRELTELTARHAVLFGLAQAAALVPGVSRSGGTITAGLLMGYTREAAARYSFLLAIPAVLGSGLFQLAKYGGELGTAGRPGAGATLLATALAFVVGYVVIIGFLRIVSTYSYRPFVLYRIAAGVVIVALLLLGVLDPLGDPAAGAGLP